MMLDCLPEVDAETEGGWTAAWVETESSPAVVLLKSIAAAGSGQPELISGYCAS